jgi:predicted TIM-barrel fold metal-dependent hydrolase
MATPTPGTKEWLDQVNEPVVDASRPIIDPHHHLWRRPEFGSYLLPDLWADTGSGHNVEKTVFVECRAGYRETGPDHLKPVGETEFVAAIAAESRNAKNNAVIAGIVAHADLTRDDLDEVLDAHEEAGRGLFRGVRHSGARDPNPSALSIPGRGAEGLYDDPAFRKGVARLGARGLTYDTWHYHHQNGAYASLARAVPGTTMILDHFGTPLGVGAYAGRREQIFAQWKSDIAEIAKCPNVVAKLGGLAMPDNGFGWDKRATPATSDELVEAQRRYYLHTIDCYGASRCMFESNFPVDKRSLSYRVLWNAFKKIVTGFSEDEKQQMFYGAAARVYRL